MSIPEVAEQVRRHIPRGDYWRESRESPVQEHQYFVRATTTRRSEGSSLC
jgi:hypothetical protein